MLQSEILVDDSTVLLNEFTALAQDEAVVVTLNSTDQQSGKALLARWDGKLRPQDGLDSIVSSSLSLETFGGDSLNATFRLTGKVSNCGYMRSSMHQEGSNELEDGCTSCCFYRARAIMEALVL